MRTNEHDNESVRNVAHGQFEDPAEVFADRENVSFDLQVPVKKNSDNDVSIITNCEIQGKPRSSGVLKVPIKRTVTMQPKKTVTFTAKKVHVHIDNSFTNMTDKSMRHVQQMSLQKVVEVKATRSESSDSCQSPVLDLSNDRQAKIILKDLATPDVSEIKFLEPEWKEQASPNEENTPAFNKESGGAPIIPRWGGQHAKKQQQKAQNLIDKADIMKLISTDNVCSAQPSPILPAQKPDDSSSFLTSQMRSDLEAAPNLQR